MIFVDALVMDHRQSFHPDLMMGVFVFLVGVSFGLDVGHGHPCYLCDYDDILVNERSIVHWYVVDVGDVKVSYFFYTKWYRKDFYVLKEICS